MPALPSEHPGVRPRSLPSRPQGSPEISPRSRVRSIRRGYRFDENGPPPLPGNGYSPTRFNEIGADGQFELLIEIIDLFLVDTDNRVESLMCGPFPRRDFGANAGHHHGLKGAARTQMGLMSFADQAEYLEQNCAQRDSADSYPRVLELSQSWGQLRPTVISTRDSIALRRALWSLPSPITGTQRAPFTTPSGSPDPPRP